MIKNGMLKYEWDKFDRACICPEAGEAQRREMKAAFYGGAMVVLKLLEQISKDDCPEQMGVAILAGINDECRRFGEALLPKNINRN